MDAAGDAPGTDTGGNSPIVALLSGQIAHLQKELEDTRAALDEERARSIHVGILQRLIDIERARIDEARETDARRINALKSENDRLMQITEARSTSTWWPFKRRA